METFNLVLKQIYLTLDLFLTMPHFFLTHLMFYESIFFLKLYVMANKK